MAALLLVALLASANARACGALQNPNPSAHGNVLIHPRIFLVLWGLKSANDDFGIIPVMKDFINSYGGSKYLRTVSQYYSNNGTDVPSPDRNMLAATWTDPNPPPGTTFPSNAQLEAEIRHARDSALWTLQEDSIVVVATPSTNGWPRAPVSCSVTATRPAGSFCNCAFHQEAATGLVLNTPYIALPYQASPTGNGYGGCYPATNAGDATTTVLAHEIAETITNPRPGSLQGWYDPTCAQGEIGDKCGTFIYTRLTTAGAGPVYSTYAVPTLWSNEANTSLGACVEADTNRKDLFYVNGKSGFHLKRAYWDDSTQNQEVDEDWGVPSAGVQRDSRPAAAALSNGVVSVFTRDPNGHIWRAFKTEGSTNPTWEDWGTLPSPWTLFSEPTAASWGAGHVDVFVIGVSGASRHVYHRGWDAVTGYGSWESWGRPSGITVGNKIAATSTVVGSVDVFVTGSSVNNLWRGNTTDRGANVTWTNWGNPGGTMADVEVSSSSTHELSAYYLLTNGTVYRRRLDSGVFTNWAADSNQPPISSFAISAVGTGEQHDFLAVNAGGTYYLGYIDANFNYGYDFLGGSSMGGPDVASW
jgi:hypothetical protein